MGASTPFWTDGTLGAVSLTFDDNAQTQLDNAIPCLNEHGLKGTFYVNPGRKPSWERDLPRWQEASRAGHEIGNHTADHPCSCNFGFRKDGFCLEKLSLQDIETTIDRATELLDEQFPEQNGNRSFCYPCYQSYVGAGVNRASYVPVVAKRFKVGRGGGERPNDPAVIDLSYVWSFAVQGHSGAEMVAYVEQAVEAGWWGIICMHGVGGEHLSVTNEAFGEVCAHLAANRSRIRTDTVINVADTIIERRRELGIE